MDLILSCYLNPSGLSRAGREYYRILSGAGLRVVPLWLMNPTPDGVEEDLAQKMISAAGRPVEGDAAQFYVGSGYAVKAIKKRSVLMGSVVFENHLLMPRQIQSYRAMDCVFPPSTFCLKACLAAGIPRSKVRLLPYPLGPEYEELPTPSIPRSGAFRFLFLNTWYERKGPDLLLRAWWDEFTSGDPVELWIKTYREEGRAKDIERDIDRLAAEYGVNRSKEAKIVVVDEVMTDGDMPAFIRSFDCYVSPHRAEGFGMNVWQAMACEVPVICTNYGGVTDFAKSDTARLITVERMTNPGPREAALFPHLASISWAEPDISSLRMQMRDAVADPAAGRQRAAIARKYVLSNYSGERVLRMFKDAISDMRPGLWEKLDWARVIEETISQPAPRFEAPGVSLRMVEL